MEVTSGEEQKNETNYLNLQQQMADQTFALKSSEQRYHKMIEEVEDYAILMLDRNGIIQNWNKGAEKIKGYKENEIVGVHFRIFYPKEDQTARLPEKLMEEAANAGRAIHEGWRVRKDGSRFWGSIVITALHDDLSRVIGFSKVTRDLTERKKAEDRIWQYTRQLEVQNKELQQFAFAAAHDMKEPLRKIQLYNSAILEDEAILLNERHKNYLLRSADAALRMQGLIDALLAFTRITEQKEQFETVDLNVTLQNVLAFFRETIDELGATVVAERLPVVRGIPFQLDQLLTNLLGNSLKYHHAERVPEIRISTKQIRRLPDSKDLHPAYEWFHRITIKDNGIGFDQKYAEKIFEMFERLHGRDQFSGSGLGLAICKKIMENHNGYMTAKGLPDQGAEFHIYLPVL
jgi:PAS domain S-box-containing protein